MPDWSFITRSPDTTLAKPQLAALEPYLKDREVAFRLNQPPSASGTMNLQAPRASASYLQPGVHELEVRRDGVLQPQLLRLTQAAPALGRVSSTITFQWEGIETYLSGLTIPAGTVENAAQSLHAWNRISAAMALTGAAQFGIVRGLVPATDPVKARTYADQVDVLSAVVALSQRADGFDFDFDTARAFNVYYPYRGQSSGLVFEYGKNLLELGFTIDAGPGAIATDVTVKGGGTTPAAATASDPTARATYGRVEVVQSLPDVTDGTAVLQGYADASMAALKQPVFVPSITIDATHPDNPWGSYWLGDTIRVRAKAGDGSYVNINKDYRIVGIIVKINDLGSETITLELNDILPMVLNRAVVAMKRDSSQPANANNSIVQPTMAERIAALERQLT